MANRIRHSRVYALNDNVYFARTYMIITTRDKLLRKAWVLITGGETPQIPPCSKRHIGRRSSWLLFGPCPGAPSKKIITCSGISLIHICKRKKNHGRRIGIFSVMEGEGSADIASKNLILRRSFRPKPLVRKIPIFCNRGSELLLSIYKLFALGRHVTTIMTTTPQPEYDIIFAGGKLAIQSILPP